MVSNPIKTLDKQGPTRTGILNLDAHDNPLQRPSSRRLRLVMHLHQRLLQPRPSLFIALAVRILALRGRNECVPVSRRPKVLRAAVISDAAELARVFIAF